MEHHVGTGVLDGPYNWRHASDKLKFEWQERYRAQSGCVTVSTGLALELTLAARQR